MFKELELELRRLAVADIVDCDPKNAELVLDSIVHNMLLGATTVLDQLLKEHAFGTGDEIRTETSALVMAIGKELLRIEAKHK